MSGTGYLHFTCRRNTVLVHRLFFYMYNGYVPEVVDHKDTNKLNNKDDNLRGSSKMFNGANQVPREGTSKYKGVSKHKNSWVAQIMVMYKHHYLGCFKNEEDAAMAYNIAAIAYFGDHAYLNKVDE